jgi:glycosyltransferase involved in cell wall biosynthesis
VHVVPHVQLGDSQAQTDVKERPGTVLFFGRIWPYKGLDYLIRAEPFITARVPNVRFVIAGRGEDLARYRALMVHPERFELLEGYISDEQRTRLFREASVIVLPYVEASQSGVIPLAYTFEKPVVATVVGGLAEVVEDLRTGCLVPPRDANKLADAVVTLLTNDGLRESCGKNGRRKIETECSPQVVADKTLAVYQATLASPRVRTAVA